MKAVKVLSVVVVIAMAAGVSVYGIDHAGRGSTFASPAAPSLDILSATAALSASSLQINAKTASMVETSSVFTDQQKQIINKELREIVLLPEQYPDIIFRSTQVSGKKLSADQYDLNITGDLTLHGVTRPVTIPTKITVTGSDLRAIGEFSIDRDDFKV